MRNARLFFLICMIAFTTSLSAQERRQGEDFGGISFKIAPPVGTFGDGFNVGWGISAMNEYVLFKNWSVSFDITYLRWGAKPNDLIDNFTMIAFTAAPKFYVWNNLYLSLEVGGFYGTTEATRGPRFEERYQFGIVPVIGYHKGVWDFAIEYALVQNRNWVNMRAGFYLFDFQLN